MSSVYGDTFHRSCGLPFTYEETDSEKCCDLPGTHSTAQPFIEICLSPALVTREKAEVTGAARPP